MGDDSKQVAQLMNEIEAFEQRQSAPSPFPPDPFSPDSSSDEEEQKARPSLDGSDEEEMRALRRRRAGHTQRLRRNTENNVHSDALELFDEEGTRPDDPLLFLRRFQPPRESFEEQVGQLEVMGFSRALATQALRLNRNNIERSIEWLTQQ